MKKALRYTFELLPARAARGKALDALLRFAEQAANEKLLRALSLTDNAGGHPALSPLALGREIAKLGIEPIIHFSCKDKNRNTIESQLFELDRYGLTTLLVLTGDYPEKGFRGRAKPVFDLDSVHLLDLINSFNVKSLSVENISPSNTSSVFKPGCVVSPFKKSEAETVGQYLKLTKKISAGACFVVTQMGFDVRKFQELLFFQQEVAPSLPLSATVFLPDAKLANIIHKGAIPGCVMPSRLLEKITQEAKGPDSGKEARVHRAARLIAVLRGIGYDEVHISGYDLDYKDVSGLIKLATDYFDKWPDYVNEFLFPEEWSWWLYDRDSESGLNRKSNVGSIGYEKLIGRIKKINLSFNLEFNKAVHGLCFEKDHGIYNVCRKIAFKIKGTGLEPRFIKMENFLKGIIYDCRHCGDCALKDVLFLCPQSQCAKFLLNGPCGGSRDGWCEVWPGRRRCMYVRIYERMKEVKEVPALGDEIVPPRDWSLNETSSWLNFYVGKDENNKKQG